MSPWIDKNGLNVECAMALTGLLLAVAVIAFIVALLQNNRSRLVKACQAAEVLAKVNA